MTDKILHQAKAWGFLCECSNQDNCQILPQQKAERWKLQLVEDRWLLIVGDVPQINLHPHEALIFLKRRCLRGDKLIILTQNTEHGFGKIENHQSNRKLPHD